MQSNPNILLVSWQKYIEIDMSDSCQAITVANGEKENILICLTLTSVDGKIADGEFIEI